MLTKFFKSSIYSLLKNLRNLQSTYSLLKNRKKSSKSSMQYSLLKNLQDLRYVWFTFKKIIDIFTCKKSGGKKNGFVNDIKIFQIFRFIHLFENSEENSRNFSSISFTTHFQRKTVDFERWKMSPLGSRGARIPNGQPEESFQRRLRTEIWVARCAMILGPARSARNRRWSETVPRTVRRRGRPRSCTPTMRIYTYTGD